MSYLRNLNSRLSSLNGQKNNIEANLRIYNKRKIDVENLIRNLTNVGDNNYSILNKYADNIINFFPSSLQGISSVSKIISNIAEKKEMSSSYDGKVASALGDLRRELSVVNSKINSLNSELISVRDRISSTKYSIWYEEKRIEEEREDNY